jgi:gamma-glutamyltranspeptidase/glutathione hydrolase
MLADRDRYAGAPAEQRPHLFAEASVRALADRAQWPALGSVDAVLNEGRLDGLMAGYDPARKTPPQDLPTPPQAQSENPSAAGVAAVDRNGSAASCIVTMNNLFGNGRIAPGTGVLLAAPPPATPPSLTPVIVVNQNSREVLFAGAASGGLGAQPALVGTMLGIMATKGTLRDAIAARRVVRLGNPDATVYESGLDAGIVEAMRKRGHDMREVPEFGRVNAIFCPEGLRTSPESCTFATDPRGSGYAAGS